MKKMKQKITIVFKEKDIKKIIKFAHFGAYRGEISRN